MMDAHSLVIIALCALVGYGVVSFSITRFRRWSQKKAQQNGNQERGDAGLRVTYGLEIELEGSDRPACVAEVIGVHNEPPTPKPSAPRRWNEVLQINATASASQGHSKVLELESHGAAI